MKKKIITLTLMGLFALAPILPVFAAAPSPAPTVPTTGIGELKQNLGNFAESTGIGAKGDSNLAGKVANIINVILGFLGIFAVIMIIIAGFKWMMAGGNEDTVKQAKDHIKNATIGLLVVFGAFIIINFAVTYLGRATGSGGTTTTETGGGETE